MIVKRITLFYKAGNCSNYLTKVMTVEVLCMEYVGLLNQNASRMKSKLVLDAIHVHLILT